VTRNNETENLVTSDRLERERIRYQWMLDSIRRLRFFFCGLVFAMLSFSLQFQVESPSKLIIGFEFGSWILLAITGFYALKDCGGFAIKLTEDVFEGLKPKERKRMWQVFFGAIVLLMFAKGLDAYMVKVDKTHNNQIQVTPKSSAPD